MNLLIDIGNTRIKWLLSQSADDVANAEIHTSETPALILPAWENIEKPKCIAIANVSQAEQSDQIVRSAQKLWPGVDVIIARTSAQTCGVTNAYDNHEHLGVDRWLALLAVNRFHSLPAIIVDCGTAITIDVLAHGGLHQGGLIVPGLVMMQQSLQQGTHQLEHVDTVAQTALGLSTPSCIANGALTTAVGLLEKVYKQLINDGESDYTLILTGGDAQMIAQHLTINAQVEVNTVLQGLAIFIDD